MNLLNNFHEYYDKKMKAYEKLYTQKRYHYKQREEEKVFISLLVIVIALAIMCFWRGAIPFMVCVIILNILFSVFNWSNNQKDYIEGIKKEVIFPAIIACFSEYRYSTAGVSESIYRESNMYYSYDKFSSSNMIKGMIDGRELRLSEVGLKEEAEAFGRNMGYETSFEGTFLKLEANYFVGNPIYIEPIVKSKVITSATVVLEKAFGLTKSTVKFDTPDFERFFEVFSQDHEEARRVLTPNFLELLLELRNRYNAKIYCTFKENNVYMLISNLKIVDVEDVYAKGLSKGTLYGNLKIIQDIVDVAELIANKK